MASNTTVDTTTPTTSRSAASTKRRRSARLIALAATTKEQGKQCQQQQQQQQIEHDVVNKQQLQLLQQQAEQQTQQRQLTTLPPPPPPVVATLRQSGSVQRQQQHYKSPSSSYCCTVAVPGFERSWLLPIFQLSAAAIALACAATVATSGLDIFVVALWHTLLWVMSLGVLAADANNCNNNSNSSSSSCSARSGTSSSRHWRGNGVISVSTATPATTTTTTTTTTTATTTAAAAAAATTTTDKTPQYNSTTGVTSTPLSPPPSPSTTTLCHNCCPSSSPSSPQDSRQEQKQNRSIFFTTRLTAAVLAVIIFILPTTTPFSRQHMVSAVHAAASIFTGARALQLSIQPQRAWGRWQVYAAYCGWGWHDMRTAVPLAGSKQRSAHIRAAVAQLCMALAGVAITRVVLELLYGQVSQRGMDFASYAGSVKEALVVVVARSHSNSSDFSATTMLALLPPTVLLGLNTLFIWSLHYVMGVLHVLAGFYLVDGLVLAVYAHVGASIDSLFGDWRRETDSVARIWSVFWNRPTARLLRDGIYTPLRRVTGSRSLASSAVFIVSGAGHTFPLRCAGVPLLSQVMMMSFFVAQIPLLWIERRLGLSGKVWSHGAIVLLSPLFVHPLLQAMKLV